MGSHVGRVGDSHVKVAGRPLRPVIHLEVLARVDPMKYSGNPLLDLPVEDLAIEGVSSVDIVRREVNEYKGSISKGDPMLTVTKFVIDNAQEEKGDLAQDEKKADAWEEE